MYFLASSAKLGLALFRHEPVLPHTQTHTQTRTKQTFNTHGNTYRRTQHFLFLKVNNASPVIKQYGLVEIGKKRNRKVKLNII